MPNIYVVKRQRLQPDKPLTEPPALSMDKTQHEKITPHPRTYAPRTSKTLSHAIISCHTMSCHVMSCISKSSSELHSTLLKQHEQQNSLLKNPTLIDDQDASKVRRLPSLLCSTLNSYSHPEFLGGLKRRTHVRFSRLSPACIRLALPPPRRAVSADSEWKERTCRGFVSGRYM